MTPHTECPRVGHIHRRQLVGVADKLISILAIQRAYISYDTAKMVVQAHHDTFTGYHTYAAQVIEEARLNGGNAYTIDGRRRNEAHDLFGKDPDRRGWRSGLS